MINSYAELAAEYGVGDTPERLEQALYKSTDCGMWIQQTDTGVRIGSIVEGHEEGTGTFEFDYPFEFDSFSNAIDEIELEADFMWREANLLEARIVMRMEDDDVLALLIDFPGTPDPDGCMCYRHVGQHAQCDVTYAMNETTAATPDQYEDLLDELEAVGYAPWVVEPTDELLADARERRVKQITDMRGN